MSPIKKLYLLLIVMIALSGTFFFYQARKANDITIKKSSTPILEENLVKIPIEEDDPTFGNPGAKNIVVIFADLNSTNSVLKYKEIKNFVDQHPLDFLVIWKDAPRYNLLFKGGLPAHLASYCAGQQGKFWDYLNAISIDGRVNSSEKNLQQVAQGLNLNLPTWSSCFKNESGRTKIDASILLSQQLGAVSIPTIFVNNRKINESLEIKQLLGELIK